MLRTNQRNTIYNKYTIFVFTKRKGEEAALVNPSPSVPFGRRDLEGSFILWEFGYFSILWEFGYFSLNDFLRGWLFDLFSDSGAIICHTSLAIGAGL
jgi:hypothetical protein